MHLFLTNAYLGKFKELICTFLKYKGYSAHEL